MAIFAGRLLDGKPCTVNGPGTQTRDYVYVEDVARANLAALDADLRSHPDPIFNVSTNRATSTNRIFGRMHGGVPIDFDATSTDCTSRCPARNWRLAIVGGISASSPDAMRSNASVGRTHMLATVSLSSWCEVWPTGLAATKKRVSNRRVVSAFGVIQWLTHAIEVVSSRRPCSPARARTST